MVRLKDQHGRLVRAGARHPMTASPSVSEFVLNRDNSDPPLMLLIFTFVSACAENIKDCAVYVGFLFVVESLVEGLCYF